jgi:hypothetical protein
MLTIAMTAPTPMMIPRAVKNVLILFRVRARRATLIVWVKCKKMLFIVNLSL